MDLLSNLNKYSVKIVKFINEIKDKSPELSTHKLSERINTELPLILKIKNIISRILSEQTLKQLGTTINKIATLNKLHSENHCSLYLFFDKYYKHFKDENINFDNYKDFAIWFNNNQHQIRYHKIYIKIKNIPELLKLFEEVFQFDTDRKKLHEMIHNNNFVGLDTIHYTEITDIDNIKIENENIDINLYIDNSFSKIYIDEVIINILNIVTFMHYLNKELIKTKVNKLKLNILLGKQKKYTYDTDILTPLNINSGSSITGELIYIWRVEELEKVLIHELLHFYGYDFHSFDKGYNIIHELISTYIDINGDDKVNESINEITANIIHMIYQSIKLKMDLSMVYEYELLFSLYQIAKIIVFYKGSTFRDIFKTSSKHITFNQTTSVLSYYIIKCMLLFYINDTMNFIEENNMKFNEEQKLINFKVFIEKILKTFQIKENLDVRTFEVSINLLIGIYKDLNKDRFISRTMRMIAIY
jgi:hypothetical protein